jgi:hypothetical protein
MKSISTLASQSPKEMGFTSLSAFCHAVLSDDVMKPGRLE